MKIIRLALLICLSLTAPAAPRVQSQTTPTSPAGQDAAEPKISIMSQNLSEAERLSEQVVALFRAGKHEEAVPLAERAVSLREQALGKDHVIVAVALGNLATLYSELKKADRARALYERALAIREAQVKPDEIAVNRLRENLGTLYFSQGDYDKAETMFSRILSSREKLYGTLDEEITKSLVNLAYVYFAMGNVVQINSTVRRIADHAEQMEKPLPRYVSRVFQVYGCPETARKSEEKEALLERIKKIQSPKVETDYSDRLNEVLKGKAISKPQPAYPDAAKQGRVQGTVIVYIVVDEKGNVVEADPICGPPLLLAASAASARKWRFTPTLLSGQPVKVTGTVSFNFRLQY